MFESDDWTYEDTFENIDEKALQSRPLCQDEQESFLSIKRPRVDDCKFSSLVLSNTGVTLDAAVNTVSNDPPAGSSKSKETRGNLLLGIFQENACKKTTDFIKETSKTSSSLPKEVPCLQSSKTKTKVITSHYKESKGKNIRSTSKAELDNKVKLVQIFPGPAGLIPETKNDNIPPASYLNNAIELENKSTKLIETNVSKAQKDERNLFDEKSWKFLLNDLPNDFFKQNGIFTIKNMANNKHYDCMKVNFVAGMIDYINYGYDNPFIILKDKTSSIEGIIHRDVTSSYPNVLEPNMVVLLRNVGLLRTVTYLVTNKYHILISRKNLLAVYSNKGRIISMPHLEDVLSSISSELDKNLCITQVSECYPAVGLQQTNENCDNVPLQTTSSASISINDRKSGESSTKCSKQVADEITKSSKIITQLIFEDLGHSTGMNDLDMNEFFAVECDFTNSAEQNCLDRSSSETILPQMQYEIQRCNESRVKSANQNPKKESTIQHFANNNAQSSSRTLQKHVTGVAVIDTHHRSRENRPLSHNEVQRCLDSNVKSTSSTMKRNAESTKNLSSYFTDNKYDPDDEFLSQLHMEL